MPISSLKELGFLTKVFKKFFLGFCTKTEQESMTQKHMKNMPYTVSEGEEHHVKSEDEIDKSHNSQLKFEYEVYLFTQNKKKT